MAFTYGIKVFSSALISLLQSFEMIRAIVAMEESLVVNSETSAYAYAVYV